MPAPNRAAMGDTAKNETVFNASNRQPLIDGSLYPVSPVSITLTDVIVGEVSRYAHGREVYQRITARAERFGAAMSPTNYYWR